MTRSCLRISTLLLLLALAAPAAWASGSYRGGGGGAVTTTREDPLYERGKALFKGRVSEHREVRYCVMGGDGAAVEVDRGALKGFRGARYAEVARGLVVCGDPEVTIVERLGRDDALALVHYLGKRYRLRLES